MRAAVVGAGPAGLTVAEELAVRGHEVVVYDMWPYPGGLLLYGIPNFKLNKEIVFAKIQYLEELGIKFVCTIAWGKIARWRSSASAKASIWYSSGMVLPKAP
jgi:glutamate synthase (NADPH/NADH) small chain